LFVDFDLRLGTFLVACSSGEHGNYDLGDDSVLGHWLTSRLFLVSEGLLTTDLSVNIKQKLVLILVVVVQ
jgi:hypothetical protein